MVYTKENYLKDVAKTRRGRLLLNKYMPGWQSYPTADYSTLYEYMRDCPDPTTPENIERMIAALNAPESQALPELWQGASLDELDNASYFEDGVVAPGPLDGDAQEIVLTVAEAAAELSPVRVSLDGVWQLAFDKDGAPDWSTAVDAPVPGGVHTALVNAGVIPDTTFGRNQPIALPYSYKDWWYRTTFAAENLADTVRLCFDGVCNRCEVYLNGKEIGAHEGMFGGPVIDVTGMLKPENELVVHLHAITFHQQMRIGQDRSRTVEDMNNSWRDTCVVNNVYGWHYSCLPSIGVWNSVRLEYPARVELTHPFVAAMDAQKGDMRMTVSYASKAAFAGKLHIGVSPDNFAGESFATAIDVAGEGEGKWLFAFTIPDAKLWWPNCLGEQNLYRLSLRLELPGGDGGCADTTFGVRTVRLAPLGDGPREDHYNWRFIVNGREAFIRGTGWCTMDAMLDFSRARYDRFLKLAHIQNCQMIRAWGCGLPEKDDFYDLCDRYGIMVMQEWPTAWNSHLQQPYDMLEETVVVNTLRIRNHPSLILYCPGNESGNPYGKAIDMMGRLSFTLDGTRTFPRGEPFGGSIHNYDSYWGRQHMDVHANLEGDFFGEFGIACTPCLESVNRYLPAEEQNVWPSKPFSAFEYHTPIFGTAYDLSRLSQMSGYFTPKDCTLAQVTVASQLSQIVGVRHTLERARIRYPDCGGALYYKLNDNFPAMSWSSVDWYGAPKLGHYVFQKSFAPTAAFLLADKLNFAGTAHDMPIYIVDDFASADATYVVDMTMCDGTLTVMQQESFPFAGDATNAGCAGRARISYEQSLTPPVLIRLRLQKNGKQVFDTFYFFNYEAEKGCLFNLPRTTLALRTEDGCAVVSNTGDVPAIGAEVYRAGHADTFTAQENFFWLDPGEEKRVPVDTADGLSVRALNA